ncbi:MAG: CoA transferase [Alphaproteobacteria bacterium]
MTAEARARSGPLSRFKVLDLTRVRAGPTAVRQLADWGADVIKIEAPTSAHVDDGLGGSRDSSDFQNLHRNKRAMTLNLKHPEGVALLKRMVSDFDVIVENYRPGVKHRLGIDYETLRLVNPRLVYASISGFGQDGPYGGLAGFDQVAQGMGGLMSITGLPGQGPVRAGIPVADLTAGLYCAQGILIALLEREQSGEGQWVQTSLLQAQVAMLDFQATRWLMDGVVPQQAGNNHPVGIPTGVFNTSDGHINIAATGDAIYRRFCEVIGRPDLLVNPDFATPRARSKNRDAINAIIQGIVIHRTSAQWVTAFNEAGVPSGPINDIKQVFDDPQVKHMGMAVAVQHPDMGEIKLVGQGVSLSRTAFHITGPVPAQGAHTDKILTGLGYDSASIAGFRERGVI